MNRIKYILRGINLLLIIVLLINLNSKTEAVERVVKFKLETLDKIKSDTLDPKQKLNVLVDETTRFNNQITQDFPYLKNGVRYLVGAVMLLISAEVVFFIRARKRIRE